MDEINNVSEISKNVCSNCGSENNDKAKFCVECGQKFQIETENVCYGCGAISPTGVKFCPECGQNLKDQTVQSETNSPSLSNLISSKKSVTQRKGLLHKLASDASKVAIKTKSDITKSIEDYTLDIEVEVVQNQEDYIVSIELPEIKKEDLEIDITPNKINIKAEFDHEVEFDQGTQILRKEIHRGTLNKDILLRKEVIPEKSIAEFEKGLLIIKLPKAEVLEGHKIKF